MKKVYVNPLVRTVYMQAERMMASSGDNEIKIEEEEYDGFAGVNERSIWDI